jgi:hypothetical protein
MVGTIRPLVEGKLTSRWQGILAGLGHMVAAGIGGACLGWIAAWAGGWILLLISPDTEIRYLVVAAITALYMLRELGLLPLPVVDLKTAVPARWRGRYGFVVGSWMYGLALGFGFTARTPFSSFHLMLLWISALANPVWGMVAGGAWGIARGILPTLLILVGKGSDDDLRTLLMNRPVLHTINGLVNGLVASLYLFSILLP